MKKQAALALALELQENCFELQRKLQQLVRLLAEGEAGRGQLGSTAPGGSANSLEPNPGLTLFELEHGDFRYTKPATIYYPDGSHEFVRTWKDVVLKVVGWGLKKDLIRDDAPTEGRRRHPLVSRSKMNLSHTHGNPENDLAQIDGWWVDTWGNVNTKARNLIAVCRSTGTDPSKFRVVLRHEDRRPRKYGG